ncbi:MAG: D-alanine-D-alanine ligase [Candidatus Binatia bacterium]|jgi:D-alanine-D-alanine ligase
MHLALVYDLREDYEGRDLSEEQLAEFDSSVTVAALAAGLETLGLTVETVGNGRALAARLVEGHRWDLVFSIAEGLFGRSREAQVPSLCELFEQPYVFSDPLTMAATLDKSVAKRLVRDCGVATTPFFVLETEQDAVGLAVPFPAFVKPLSEGTGKGCENASVVRTHEELVASARSLFERFAQPVLVEPYLSGREFTVGIVGNGASARVVGVAEIVLRPGADVGVYSLRNKEECESLVRYQRADDEEAQAAAEAAMAAYRALGCRDAARLDFRSDDSGQPQFLEANPIAGLHPSHSDLPIIAGLSALTYEGLLGEIVDAARERYAL